MQLLVSAWSSNFGLDRIYNFGDIAIFIFRHFGLKLSIPGLLSVLGAYFPEMTSFIVLTTNKHLTRKHVARVIKRENRFSGSTWARDEKKGQES